MRLQDYGKLLYLTTAVCAGAWAADVQPGAPVGPSKYNGPGSCSSTSCHGGVQPRTETTVLQNEYSTWAVQDKYHPHAFLNLSNPVGKRMGRILNIEPEKSKKCLDCHALNVADDQKARTFDANDGVSCESCHGPASNWLGEHTRKDWKYEKSIPLGMYDTRNLILRSERCVSCHVGTAEKYVDHEMIAAGHPDLYFEQASFEAVMPRHWKMPADTDPWIEARTLAVGQAIQLRENLHRVARSANRFWPEYAELDCFSCHHSLTAAKDSWRQERGYPGRRAGNPPFNPSRYVVFREVANDLGGTGDLDAQVKRVYALVSDITAKPADIAAAAKSAADATNGLAHRMETAQFEPASVMRMMKTIAATSDQIASQGVRAAEQAAMAFDSLFVAYNRNAKAGNEPQMRAAMNVVFQTLENPSAFSPESFTKAMRNAGSVLR